MRNGLRWFRELITDIPHGEGHILFVIPMFSEMTKAWCREISLKTISTGIKSF